MKRLSYKQIQKKSELLNKFKASVKGKTKNLLSKHWQKYREKKFVIEELPKYRLRLRSATKEQRELLKEKYYDRKSIAVKKLEYGDLIVSKKVRQKYSNSDYYKLRGKKSLDETVEKIFEDKKNVRYVLVTLKIKLKETGQVIYVSDSLNRDSFAMMQEMEVDLIEKILEKLSFVAKYDGFELISQHIRVIYATSTNTKIKEKHRTNKR